MNHSASQVISKHLIDVAIFEPTDPSATWPLYIGHLPGGKSLQQAAAITDSEGLMDGRLMNGEVIDHPGIQIRTRSRVYGEGFKKISEASDNLSELTKFLIVMPDGISYTISNVSRVSSILPIGVEPGTRLFLFSVNFLVTLK